MSIEKLHIAITPQSKFSISISSWKFAVAISNMWKFAVNVSEDTPPLLQSLVLISPDTVRITYDKALNESIIPALGDYVFGWSALVDLDGNRYHEVTIGTQVWIVENLKVTKYADGSAIPLITDNATWAADTAGAMCYYNNDEAAYKATYGGLYNWHAVNNVAGLAKLTKNGVDQLYRVPTATDWANLSTELGGDAVAGGKLKEMGLAHWLTPNTGADNSSGFTALPGGFRADDGSFNDINGFGYLWSATESDINNARIKDLEFSSDNFGGYPVNKKSGMTIRLVKDL